MFRSWVFTSVHIDKGTYMIQALTTGSTGPGVQRVFDLSIAKPFTFDHDVDID